MKTELASVEGALLEYLDASTREKLAKLDIRKKELALEERKLALQEQEFQMRHHGAL